MKSDAPKEGKKEVIAEMEELRRDPQAAKFLGTITKETTRRAYAGALRLYVKFTGLTPSKLVDEALDDQIKDPRQKRDIAAPTVAQRLISFYQSLKDRGLTDWTATSRVMAVRAFYSDFDVVVRLKGRKNLPKPAKANERLISNAAQVKVLLDHAPNIRDRAVILTLFQSGLDVSTLCSLKYGDVAPALAPAFDLPFKLEMRRRKTGTDFYTFLGRSAVEAIKASVKDAQARGAVFAKDTPLFLQRGGEGIETHNIQSMMKEVAKKAGFIDGKGYNVLGPHALRESFGSIMINSGVTDSIVDFLLGHEIGDMAEAYKRGQYESVRQMYKDREKLLDPYAGTGNGAEALKKVKALEGQLAILDPEKLQNEIKDLNDKLLKTAIDYGESQAQLIDLQKQIHFLVNKMTMMENWMRSIKVEYLTEDYEVLDRNQAQEPQQKPEQKLTEEQKKVTEKEADKALAQIHAEAPEVIEDNWPKENIWKSWDQSMKTDAR